ncbi:hypothetical protein GCM10025792_41790 [Pseudonocardia tropica]
MAEILRDAVGGPTRGHGNDSPQLGDSSAEGIGRGPQSRGGHRASGLDPGPGLLFPIRGSGEMVYQRKTIGAWFGDARGTTSIS